MSLELHHLTPTIGTEIGGVDLDRLDDATFDAIETLLMDRGVVFLRDQAHIEPDAHLDFARRFGELEVYPFKTGNANFSPHPSGIDEIVRLAHGPDSPGRENEWHSDVTWMVEPSMGSVLRAIELPPSGGGDTMFCDARAAFDSLDANLAAWLCELSAHHDWLGAFGSRIPPALLAQWREDHPGADHPVIRTHPVTGRKAIYVNRPFTTAILGMDFRRSKALKDYLIATIEMPEFHCRFRWEPGSIAVWDNRSVQHYAVNDYEPEVRVMDRVTIAGDKPYQ